METILKKEQKSMTNDIADFLLTLNEEEKKSFKEFIQGFKFAAQLYKEKGKETVRN
ncbi:hypothetical protein [Clostridium beijerinckii]|uniref:hypothetical protein n=1 Tax=Clostridium beijerinckii TaxID=1520 RepID=UPI0003D30067|nr:hypothetical protein [Clostridium beijerinckii]